MWTEEKLFQAADEWNNKWIEDNKMHIFRENKFGSHIEAFIAGCEYIIKNTQKD